jgi:hypothetical protein
VPLWLFALVVIALIWRNRRLRNRPGNVSVRMREAPGTSWSRGNGVWVDDVFAVRHGLADRSENFMRVTAATSRTPGEQEAKDLRRLEDPVIAALVLTDGRTIEIAVPRRFEGLLLGPFATADVIRPEVADVDQLETSNVDQAAAAAP